MICERNKWDHFKSNIIELKLHYVKYIKVINIVLLYRYFSLLITSVLFFFTAPHKGIFQKLITIGGLVLACSILTYLYLNNRNNRKHIFVLTIVETLGNSIFIILSGGFASPYIWYFISTLLIAAVELPKYVAIFSATVYFFTASIATGAVLIPAANNDMIRLYLNTAIGYIIVATVLLQLIQYVVKVEEKTNCLSIINQELKEAKIKVEKTLKYCIEIYETVNIFNLDGNQNVLKELLDHIRHLTGVEQSMFIRLSPADKKGIYVSYGLQEGDKERVASRANQLIMEEPEDLSPKYCDFDGRRLSVHYVIHGENPCGAFVAITDEKYFLQELGSENIDKFTKEQALLYDENSVIPIFMKIAGIVLKKLELDDIGEKLLISEEQNRIANEIHDVALQKLFGISCSLYVLSAESQKLSPEALKSELLGIKSSVDITMRELREAIYGFSWEKEGEDTFRKKLMKYTEEIRNLQGVAADTVIVGDTQRIRANQKNGLYRVICEAMNNAIRHGKATHIGVRVVIGITSTTVRITDDGNGFDYKEYQQQNNKGLGIGNIYRIIELLSGHIEMNSQITGGTEIFLSIPSRPAA